MPDPDPGSPELNSLSAIDSSACPCPVNARGTRPPRSDVHSINPTLNSNKGARNRKPNGTHEPNFANSKSSHTRRDASMTI
jgi:hypothetical protein